MNMNLSVFWVTKAESEAERQTKVQQESELTRKGHFSTIVPQTLLIQSLSGLQIREHSFKTSTDRGGMRHLLGLKFHLRLWLL